MLFGFDRNSVRTLYAPRFYGLSCLMNMVCMGSAFALVPQPDSSLAAAGFLQAAFLLAEGVLRRGKIPIEALRRRYLAKIFAGMLVIGVSVFLIDRDYIIYIPVVMGMLYLNVNTILRSTVLHYLSIGFSMLSIVKAVLLHHGTGRETAEYAAMSVLLVASSMLSLELFRSNKREYEENERQTSALMAVSKMLNQLLLHDVNNALTSIFIVAGEKYRSDKVLFMEELERRVDVVKELIDSRIWDHQDAVDVGEVLDQMTVLLAGPRVAIRTEIVDSRRVVTSRNMLYSILRNLLENSMEAASRADQDCCIRVRKVGRSVAIEDDCGGFDVEAIRSGRTSKPGARGHGVFLSTITSPVIQVAFGFNVDVSRTRDGTRVELIFDRLEGDAPSTGRPSA